MLIAVAAIFVSAMIINALFEKTAFKGVCCNLEPDRKIAEINEEITVTSTVSNQKSVPLDCVYVDEYFPNGIIITSSTSTREQDKSNIGFNMHHVLQLSNRLYMRHNSKNTIKRCVRIEKRGRYVFHGCSVKIGTFLGLSELEKSFYIYKEIIILPKRIETDEVREIVGGIIGDISVRRFIFEDPILTMGYREYTGREPMKAISWTQTAKSGALTVKKYDFTTEITVSVVLCMSCERSAVKAFTQKQVENMERAISITRTVCETLDLKRIPYSFTTNAHISGGRRIRLSLKDGFGQAHLMAVLESLGRASYDTLESVRDTVLSAKINIGESNTVILITSELTAEFEDAAEVLKKAVNCRVIDAGELLVVVTT